MFLYFLLRNKAEVKKMCLYEYDEERQRRWDREEGREEKGMDIARMMLQKGRYSEEEIAELTGLELEEVFRLGESMRQSTEAKGEGHS